MSSSFVGVRRERSRGRRRCTCAAVPVATDRSLCAGDDARQEREHYGIESLGLLEAREMARPGDRGPFAAGESPSELIGDPTEVGHIVSAVDHEGRHVEGRQPIREILCEQRAFGFDADLQLERAALLLSDRVADRLGHSAI